MISIIIYRISCYVIIYIINNDCNIYPASRRSRRALPLPPNDGHTENESAESANCQLPQQAPHEEMRGGRDEQEVPPPLPRRLAPNLMY